MFLLVGHEKNVIYSKLVNNPFKKEDLKFSLFGVVLGEINNIATYTSLVEAPMSKKGYINYKMHRILLSLGRR